MTTKPHAARKHDRERFESLFKRWKRSVEKAGLIQELRQREFYEKPSVRRKRAKAAAIKRNQRRVAEERENMKLKGRRLHKKKNEKETS